MPRPPKGPRRSPQEPQPGPGGPDAAAMLLLVLLVLSTTLVLALGAFTALPREDPHIVRREHAEIVDLFLDARAQAVPALEDLGGQPTLATVNQTLEHGLVPVLHRARSLGVQANVSIAGGHGAASVSETGLLDADDRYESGLFDAAGEECYGLLPYDGAADGLLREPGGGVMASLLRIEIQAPTVTISEALVVDNQAVDADAPCTP